MNELKDIKIGPTNHDWIEWVEFDEAETDLIEIDSFILEQKRFWDKLETQCLKDCCGFDAYSFYPDAIRKAKVGELNIDDYLKQLMDWIDAQDKTVFISSYMNQLVHRTTFMNLLEHIKQVK